MRRGVQSWTLDPLGLRHLLGAWLATLLPKPVSWGGGTAQENDGVLARAGGPGEYQTSLPPTCQLVVSQVGSGRREQLGGKAREEAPGCDKPRGQEAGLPGLL